MGGYSSSKFTLKEVTLTDSTTVGHGPSTDTQLLQPDAGKIWEVISWDYYAADPAGSGAGTHKVELKQGVASNGVASIVATTGNAVVVNQNGFTGDSSESPAAVATQYLFMRDGFLWASNSLPITVLYTNSTDVDKTGGRTCKFIVKEYNELI